MRFLTPSIWVETIHNIDYKKLYDSGKRAIYFDIDTQILIERIVNRQSCPNCGEIYNKKFKHHKCDA